MKKVLLIALTILLTLSVTCAVAESVFNYDACNEDYRIRYIVNKQGFVEIDGFECIHHWREWTPEMKDREIDLVIPAELDGSPVAVITSFFAMDPGSVPSRVRSITIPDSVLSISDGAFSGYDLSQIIISPEHPVFEVVDGVLFNKTTGTLICYPAAKEGESYTVPDGTRVIGSRAFSGCSLKTLTLPDSVTTVYSDAFTGCSALETLNLGSGITEFAKPFASRQSPTPLAFSHYLREIHVSAANSAYCSVDGILYSADGTTLVCYPCGRTDERLVLPEGVTSIAPYAFADCHTPLAVALPDSFPFAHGEALTVHIYPLALTDERMQQFLSADGLSRADQRKLESAYRLVEPGTSTAKKLVSTFPALADTALWIERSASSGKTLSGANQAKVAGYFTAAGYTSADLAIDDALLAAGPRSLYPYTIVCEAFSMELLPEGSTLIVKPDSLAQHWAGQNGVNVTFEE